MKILHLQISKRQLWQQRSHHFSRRLSRSRAKMLTYQVFATEWLPMLISSLFQGSTKTREHQCILWQFSGGLHMQQPICTGTALLTREYACHIWSGHLVHTQPLEKWWGISIPRDQPVFRPKPTLQSCADVIAGNGRIGSFCLITVITSNQSINHDNVLQFQR